MARWKSSVELTEVFRQSGHDGRDGKSVLASFTTAMLVAFVAPRIGFGLICAALLLHLRPEVAPGSDLVRSLMKSTRTMAKVGSTASEIDCGQASQIDDEIADRL